jgi:CxxC motif-containing protein (DUF1111 family)
MSKGAFLTQMLTVFVGSAFSLFTIAVAPEITQLEATQSDSAQFDFSQPDLSLTNLSLTDFTGPERDEHLSGGSATSLKSINRNSFSHASQNLKFDQELNFKVGNGIFRKIWVSAPASTLASDGLGPLFNAKSCQRCHLKDGRGHPPQANWPEDNAVSMLLRLSIPAQSEQDQAQLDSLQVSVIPEPTYGTQLQDFSIQGHKAEGYIQIEYEEIEVSLSENETVTLRKPIYSVVNLGYGPMHPDTLFSARIAPPMIGLGLLEMITEADVLAQTDPNDKDNDGISGRAAWSRNASTQSLQLGRFGWKAGEPTLDHQNQVAFNGDIGLSTPIKSAPGGDCTSNQSLCLSAPSGDSPQYEDREVGQIMTDLVLFYTQNLAVPARRNVGDEIVLAGKRLFYKSGCVACHKPSYVTGTDDNKKELSNQKIWPYTDLLLHDMGEGLADNRSEGVANGREWRTSPLWGIGLTQTVNGHSQFLHDGRARGFLEAILWHGGEAQSAKQKVVEMTAVQRQSLLAFLESL